MEDELQLPTIPQTRSEPQLPRPSYLRLNLRKRSTRSDEVQDDDALSSSLHTSSDPALFSSDETPDAENYSGAKRRKKKTYAGTWWGERSSRTRSSSRGLSSTGKSHMAKKRAFIRNLDSGIFMNSDDGSSSAEFSSDSSFGNELMGEQQREQELTPKAKAAPRTPVMVASKLALRFGSVSPLTPRAVKTPTVQERKWQYVMSIVRDCLDDGKEDVDLSGMELDSLPSEIREIATMIKDEPASQVLFESLVARPRLYLSSNLLRQFPTSILELSNLRLLSLRQNKLTQIPPGIRDLVKLETLNIAGNKLQSLPVEVLDLMTNCRLTKLLSEPNPWHAHNVAQKEATLRESRLSSRLKCFSLVGDPKRSDDDYYVTLRQVATSEQRIHGLEDESQRARKQVPSLSELVLRQLSKLNTTKRSLASLMLDETPANVTERLDDLYAAQSAGDRKCAWCKRLYVKPAQMWIEWWDIVLAKRHQDHPTSMGVWPGDHIVPFEIGICGGCA